MFFGKTKWKWVTKAWGPTFCTGTDSTQGTGAAVAVLHVVEGVL